MHAGDSSPRMPSPDTMGCGAFHPAESAQLSPASTTADDWGTTLGQSRTQQSGLTADGRRTKPFLRTQEPKTERQHARQVQLAVPRRTTCQGRGCD